MPGKLNNNRKTYDQHQKKTNEPRNKPIPSTQLCSVTEHKSILCLENPKFLAYPIFQQNVVILTLLRVQSLYRYIVIFYNQIFCIQYTQYIFNQLDHKYKWL